MINLKFCLEKIKIVNYKIKNVNLKNKFMKLLIYYKKKCKNDFFR